MSSHVLTLHEKFSGYWPSVAVLSAVSAAALFVYSRIQAEVLKSGYLELASFILFSVAVFSFFKLRDGRITISIELEDDGLKIVYLLKNKTVLSEQLPAEKIDDLKTDRMPDSSLYTEINRSDRTIRFREKDSGEWHYLFQYNSRVIPLSAENAEHTVQLLQKSIQKRK